jgi:hypothetical protein
MFLVIIRVTSCKSSLSLSIPDVFPATLLPMCLYQSREHPSRAAALPYDVPRVLV